MGNVAEGARCKLYNRDGALVGDIAVESAILHLNCADVATIELSGVASVFECVEK
jgi:hypothetical protein